MPSVYRIGLVGLGHRGYKTHFLSLHGSASEHVVAVCDANKTTLEQFSKQHPDVSAYQSIEELLAHHELDFALICLPHSAYGQCVKALADASVPILKEKPAANDMREYESLVKLPIPIGITCQRRFEPRYHQLLSLLPMLGRIVSFRAVLARNIENLSSSWRASGVGVTEDLGVHLVDILIWLFGKPDSLLAMKADAVRQFQKYSGDDIADISFKWNDKALIGSIHLSRVAHTDIDTLTITGTSGTLIMDGKKVSLVDGAGSPIVAVDDTSTKQMVVRRMARGFGDFVTGVTTTFGSSIESHQGTVLTLDAAKRSFLSEASEVVQSGKEEHCPWPIITPEIERAFVDQAHSSMSIYNRSNIYETFEERWKALHGLKHVLTCSAGTIAILHMFEALKLQPGDEILCPVYTFFATATPMLQYGAVPVFCDSLDDGNLDPREIIKRSTSKTKAVIVTHMWGLPCRMKEVMENARRVNGGIKVLEDCSHAHTAIVDGKMVGTWGDMAAWSLQAKKNITGGQAGVFATNSTEYYAHAVTHGHFNKRAKQEVPADHPLRKYWLTGLGLNLRAHPLAIAMANVQLTNHPIAQKWREYWARYLAQNLQVIPFLRMPDVANQDSDRHAWYAFVMQFDASRSPEGLDREKFVKLLNDKGLTEVDIPRSTGLLHDLPLFTETAEAFPRFGQPGPWKAPQTTDQFPRAMAFYNGAIKLPVWSRPQDEAMVNRYVKGFIETAHECVAEAGNGIKRQAQIQARL